ncbi:hypothetical protein BGX34_000576 [Mortierella sp. NVP85]|nr:hypothetical protein BGX34_000576 [Mortierella sp. NVP85]
MVSSPRSFSAQQTLSLTSLCLEYAQGATDAQLALELCDDAEVALSGIKRSQRKALTASKKDEDQTLIKRIATSYFDLGMLQNSLGLFGKAHANFKKAAQWDRIVEQSSFFNENVDPPAVVFTPPEPDERLYDTRLLAACLSLLRPSAPSIDDLEPTARKWLRAVKNNVDEQERLWSLATDVIREFVGDELKETEAVAEVMLLAPVLDQQDYRFLIGRFFSSVDQSDLISIQHLQGLADMIHGVDPGYLRANDLVEILELISARLEETHLQSSTYLYQLALGITHILDAIADTKVNGLDREKIHAPFDSYLEKLGKSSDPCLVYQAAYAYQALQYVMDNETPWQPALRRTGKVIQGVSGLMSATEGLDLDGFMKGLEIIQKGMGGVSAGNTVAKTTYKDVTSLAKGGKEFLDILKESFSFDRKQAWYSALRGADTLIRDGHLVKFKTLACEAACRRDPAFQWGVCQRLGEIAANSMWGLDTQRDAVSFLGDLYRSDADLGQQAHVKQWILTILTQLSSLRGSIAPCM